MRKLCLIATVVFLAATPARGDIYQRLGEDGVLHFTNTPSGGEFRVYLREGPGEAAVASSRTAAPDWVYSYAAEMSRINNLEPALIKAIIKAESNGRMKAVSPKGAQGMMQLMPFTSARLKVSDPFDPIQNIEGGVKYIKELVEVFKGNLVHAVAAYNAGPQAVQKHGGVPPYRETRDYVNRVMGYYRQYSRAE